MRNFAPSISAEELHDLNDALHNVPDSIWEYGVCFDEQIIRNMYLAPFDEKWGEKEFGIRLTETLDGGMEMAGWRIKE